MEQKYIQGDIHNVIKTLKTNSIDFIYTDPPFNITSAKWDKGLNWEELFPEMFRVLKPKGIIALYASMPFTYELISTPVKYKYMKPKYHYTWEKNNSTGFFSAKYQPLRNNEEIFIYYKKAGTYNPQMEGNEFHQKREVVYGGKNEYWGKSKKDNKYTDKGGHNGRFPKTVKKWKIRKDDTGITRDDKQIDYFIKTYTNEGDTILDMTCHTKIVGDRANKLKRKYIGVDLNIM